MTKKETIALRYYTAHTEVTGDTFSDSDVTYLASHRSAAWLEEKAVAAEKKLAVYRAENAKKDYLESEEGKAAIDIAEKYGNDLEDKENIIRKSVMTTMEDLLKSAFGDDVKVTIRDNGAEIGIRDTTKDYDTFKFGHSFNVYYDKRWTYNPETKTSGVKQFDPEINFGTMCSFNPVKEKDYSRFISMISAFANDPKWLKALVSLIETYREEVKPLNEFADKLYNWRKDPLNTPKPWAEFDEAA